MVSFVIMETRPGAEMVEASAGWSPASVMERVVDRLSSADARTIYGSPVERNGTTVIPVAEVRYGFGGGAGRKRNAGEEGTGAGGGVHVTPVGFIEMVKDKVRFRRIRKTSPLLAALGFGIGALLLARAVRAAIFRHR
jgi:uncharacterized spore protein YtfJ